MNKKYKVVWISGKTLLTCNRNFEIFLKKEDSIKFAENISLCADKLVINGCWRKNKYIPEIYKDG